MKFNFFSKPNKESQTVSVKPVIDVTDYSKNDNEYRLVFNDKPNDQPKCEVISFGDFTEPALSDNLTIYHLDQPVTILHIRYSYATWDRKEAIKFFNFIAVGLSGFFCLYNLSTKRFVLFIDLKGYFYSLSIANEYLLLAYHSGIYCITKFGEIKWHNFDVGLDGITIDEIKDGKIYGSEQIDPPDGWSDFVLDLETGANAQ